MPPVSSGLKKRVRAKLSILAKLQVSIEEYLCAKRKGNTIFVFLELFYITKASSWKHRLQQLVCVKAHL